MDGNGRWAKNKHLPRSVGHREGVTSMRRVVEACYAKGVKVVSFYAFSTENWSRPEKEVKFIMNLPVEFYDRYVPELHRQGVKIQMLGDVSRLPAPTLDSLRKAEVLTAENTGLVLNFALNYGGRAEIQEAIRAIVAGVQAGTYS